MAAYLASRRGALVVLGVIIGAFIAFGLLWLYANPGAIGKPFSDGLNYEDTAKQLLTRGFFAYREAKPNAGVTPGYPIFLTAVYAVTGHGQTPPGPHGGPYRLIYGLQLLFAAGSIAMTYLIGSELLGRIRGLMAALILALFPPMQQTALKLLTEPLSTLLFLAYVYVQLLAIRRKSKALWFTTGLLFGATVMVRPGFSVICVVPVAYLLFTRYDRRQLLVGTGLLVAGMAVIISPWFVRNLVTLHRPVVLSERAGDALLAGIDPYHYDLGPQYRNGGPTYQDYSKHHPFIGPWQPAYQIDKQDYAVQAIGKMVRRNPLGMLEWFTLGKLRSMFTRRWESGTGPMASVTWVSLITMVAFGFMGMALAFKEPRFRLLSLIVLVGILSLLPFVPEPRFVFGLMPLLAVLAAGVIFRTWTLRGPDDDPADDRANPRPSSRPRVTEPGPQAAEDAQGRSGARAARRPRA